MIYVLSDLRLKIPEGARQPNPQMSVTAVAMALLNASAVFFALRLPKSLCHILWQLSRFDSRTASDSQAIHIGMKVKVTLLLLLPLHKKNFFLHMLHITFTQRKVYKQECLIMSEANYQSSIRWELRGIDLILKETFFCRYITSTFWEILRSKTNDKTRTTPPGEHCQQLRTRFPNKCASFLRTVP